MSASVRMSASRPLGIVGAGAWGTALANIAAANGRRVVLWMRDGAQADRMAATRENPRLTKVRLHANIRPTSSLRDLGDAAVALLVTPAQTTREVAGALRSVLPSDAALVLCGKGIERGSNAFLSEVAGQARAGAPLAVLSGPSFAADVARGLPTAVTLAATDEALARNLAETLSGPSFRVYHGTDVRGVEIGGAAKNVLAIACGAVAGRGLGESAKAALIARGFAELLRFARAYGGQAETLMGLSGLGDLVLTCSSAQSRNYAFGERLGGGMSSADAAAGKLVEGALTASALIALARDRNVDMPIAEAVDGILTGAQSLGQAVEALMARPIKAEL
jgi:glycerol-3-phosphate dehydrogenase (NAD(P)+)